MQSTVSLATILHKRSTSITYARSNYYMRQVKTLRARVCGQPKCSQEERYLGTISAKLLMYLDETRLDENLAPERLNAQPLDASACKEKHKHYIRQAESLHTPGRIITYARV